MTYAPRSEGDPTTGPHQSVQPPAPHVPPPWPALHPSEPIPPSPTPRRRKAPAALALVGVVALLAGAAGAAAGVAARDGSFGSSSSATPSPRAADGSGSSSSNSFNLPTDSSSFNLAGVPTLSFFTGSHEDYHRPTDTADRVDAAGIDRIVPYATTIVSRRRLRLCSEASRTAASSDRPVGEHQGVPYAPGPCRSSPA